MSFNNIMKYKIAVDIENELLYFKVTSLKL